MKKIIQCTLVISVLIVSLVIYNSCLNQQIKIIEQDILIEQLPESFEGFKVLQITDLQGQYFGDNQEHLIKVINSIDYDLLAFTGDMGDLNFDLEGKALKVLIERLPKDKLIVYVEGNHGPFVRDHETGEKTEMAEWLENQGINLLFEPLCIEIDGNRLWIVEQTEPFSKTEGLDDMKENDVLIGIMHYPLNEELYKQMRESDDSSDYDLILAGHYHGGQWRIPFYGAVFISNVYGSRWFPSQESVSGLTIWSGYQQYVSRGLGASGRSGWIKQRWFNPPEVNVLTLTDRR